MKELNMERFFKIASVDQVLTSNQITLLKTELEKLFQGLMCVSTWKQSMCLSLFGLLLQNTKTGGL